MKSILSLSGGLDSTTVLHSLLLLRQTVQPIWFGYGSKHNRFEWQAVKKIVAYFHRIFPNQLLPLIEMDLMSIFQHFHSNLLLSGGKIPHGHYTHQSMKKTVVPNRNGIFLSILTGLAESTKAKCIALGIHQGDHAIYPDCRSAFFKAAELASELSTEGRVHFVAPFLYGDKTDIVQWGLLHHTPYELTRTCYETRKVACGKCGSCRERLEAFQKNHVKDPLPYEKTMARD